MPWKSWLLHDRILIIYNGLSSSQDSWVEKSWNIKYIQQITRLNWTLLKWNDSKLEKKTSNTQCLLMKSRNLESTEPVGCIPCHLLFFCAFINAFANLKCQHYGGEFKMLINACFKKMLPTMFVPNTSRCITLRVWYPKPCKHLKLIHLLPRRPHLWREQRNGAARFRWRAWCLLHKANP